MHWINAGIIDQSDIDGLGRLSPAVINNWAFKNLMKYHQAELIRDGDEFDSSRKYIFGLHPHGHIAFFGNIARLGRDERWNKWFPGIDFRTLTASAALKLPLLRELFLWTDCIDARRESARKALARNLSLFVYPGGEREQLMTTRFREQLYIKDRKGFIRLALEEGADVVPAYLFNHNDMYENVEFGIGFRRWIQRKFKVAVPIFYGRLFMMPYPVKALMVVGQPIRVEAPVANPTAAQIDQVHAKYVEELIGLFEKYKARAGVPDRKLELF
jgi:1-acyl-sn-glycerol-3-phosphate acyltransferase